VTEYLHFRDGFCPSIFKSFLVVQATNLPKYKPKEHQKHSNKDNNTAAVAKNIQTKTPTPDLEVKLTGPLKSSTQNVRQNNII
jgi:hypothetical protein